jgi:prepilin-type N-terminal cleavage/methylation domain-containing protein
MISPKILKSHIRWNSNQPRSGFTLIEMLAVMTMASILLGVMFLMLVGIIRRMNSADLQLARQSNVAQVAETLRELAHKSNGFELSQDGQKLTLRAPTGSEKAVQLQLSENPFRLEIFKLEDSPKKRIFGLKGLDHGRFSRIEISNQAKPVIVLELWPDPAQSKRLNQPAPSQNRTVRIEAATGLDLTENAIVKEPVK